MAKQVRPQLAKPAPVEARKKPSVRLRRQPARELDSSPNVRCNLCLETIINRELGKQGRPCTTGAVSAPFIDGLRLRLAVAQI